MKLIERWRVGDDGVLEQGQWVRWVYSDRYPLAFQGERGLVLTYINGLGRALASASDRDRVDAGKRVQELQLPARLVLSSVNSRHTQVISSRYSFWQMGFNFSLLNVEKA